MKFQDKLNQAFQRFEAGDLKEAKRIYKELFDEDLSAKQEIQIRFLYGYLLVEKNQLDEALKNYQQTLDLAYTLEDNTLISQSHHQIGMVHRIAKQYDKGSFNFRRKELILINIFRIMYCFSPQMNMRWGL